MSNYVDKTVVDNAVRDAFVAEGYVRETGTRDIAAMLQPILEHIALHKVHSKDDRKDLATPRKALVTIAFPKLPTKDEYEQFPEPKQNLAKAVYDKIYEEIWGLTGPLGVLQEMVGRELGNGWIMCRTAVNSNRDDAIYITNDFECVRLDLTKKNLDALEQRIGSSHGVPKMAAARLPRYAEKFLLEYDKMLSNKAIQMKNEGQTAIEAAKDSVKSRKESSKPPTANTTPDEKENAA